MSRAATSVLQRTSITPPGPRARGGSGSAGTAARAAGARAVTTVRCSAVRAPGRAPAQHDLERLPLGRGHGARTAGRSAGARARARSATPSGSSSWPATATRRSHAALQRTGRTSGWAGRSDRSAGAPTESRGAGAAGAAAAPSTARCRRPAYGGAENSVVAVGPGDLAPAVGEHQRRRSERVAQRAAEASPPRSLPPWSASRHAARGLRPPTSPARAGRRRARPARRRVLQRRAADSLPTSWHPPRVVRRAPRDGEPRRRGEAPRFRRASPRICRRYRRRRRRPSRPVASATASASPPTGSDGRWTKSPPGVAIEERDAVAGDPRPAAPGRRA